MNLGELRALLDERQCGYSDDTLVQAITTPHHIVTFGIVYLTGSLTGQAPGVDVITLHLAPVEIIHGVGA